MNEQPSLWKLAKEGSTFAKVLIFGGLGLFACFLVCAIIAVLTGEWRWLAGPFAPALFLIGWFARQDKAQTPTPPDTGAPSSFDIEREAAIERAKQKAKAHEDEAQTRFVEATSEQKAAREASERATGKQNGLSDEIDKLTEE
jgi:Predicted membrane-associated, metal-dependent hydrolase